MNVCLPAYISAPYSHSSPGQSPYPSAGIRQGGAADSPASLSAVGNRDGSRGKNLSRTSQKNEKLAEMIRGLNQKPAANENPYIATTQNKTNGFLELSGSPEAEEAGPETAGTEYNFKDVSSQIQRAKTSSSAGQAVMKANRKVMELKRKLASGNGDTEELQIALTHAKQMERVAKKKKRHLELEEMIAAVQKRDEAQETDGTSSGPAWSPVDIAKERIAEAQEEIDRQQEAMSGEMTKSPEEAFEMEEMQEAMSVEALEAMPEELMADMADTLDAFGDEAQEMLEEAMEQLEALEVIDPHMSSDDLKELRIKHRNAERKDIIKADMDYLKDMIEHMEKKGSALPGSGMSGSAAGSPLPSLPGISMPSVGSAPPVSVSLDIQV